MKLKPRELAQVLAALRYAANLDLLPLGHLGGVEGGQLPEDEVAQLCQEINCETELESAYTVVGLFPKSDWDGSLYDASFVETVEAESLAAAIEKARIQAAWNRCTDVENESDEVRAQRIAKLATDTSVFAVFKGSLHDLYDPRKDEIL